MRKKVLVTGAYGLLGSHTVRELIENGYHVRAFGRDPEKLSELASEYDSGQIEVYCGDFCNASDIDKACAGMDYVVHCGALLKGWGRRSDFIKTNVGGTKNVLDACEKNKIKRLAYTSSPSAHALRNNTNITEADQNWKNRLNYYIESKLLAEKLVREQSKVPWAMIRPRGITGIGDKNMLPVLIKVNKQIGIPLFQKGKVMVDLVCAENAALALRLCLEKDAAVGQAYNITNGEPRLVTELAEEMFTALGTEAKYIRLPFMPVYAAAGLLEAVWKLLRIYDKAPPITRMDVCTLGRSQIFSIEKARKELGYEPKVSIGELIKKYAEDYGRG
ncbi:MAG: SDR family NAD(P)-dependent oxidoreductase [Mogibacterium sp.]|nr:SDR family NAD(P)-dependent oxidoreductase [Mogibacterium sp.]